MRRSQSILASLVLVLAAGTAHANTFFTWTGVVNGNINVAGSVDFAVVPDGLGYDLIITLKNTSNEAQEESSAVISGLFFNIKVDGIDPGPLSMKAAIAPDGLISTVGTSPDSGTLGSNICGLNTKQAANVSCSNPFQGGWQFNYDAAGWSTVNPSIPVGIKDGLGTAGLGGIFKGQDVNGPGGNFDYGIVDNVGVGNGGFDAFPYTLGTGVFTFSGLSSNNVEISQVLAAYGTAPEGVFTTTQENDTPEPATLLELGGGIVLLAFRRLRRKSVVSSLNC